VPGFGWECFEGWLESEYSGPKHVSKYGYEVIQLHVDGISGTENNARQINEQIASLPPEQAGRPIILLGYSKGAPDVLQAVVDYPELAEKVVAVISAAGAVGGSALANGAKQSQANMLTKIPKSDCSEGDGGAVNAMRPATRQKWLAENDLPEHISYYSVATFPDPEHISSALKSSYRKLGKIDGSLGHCRADCTYSFVYGISIYHQKPIPSRGITRSDSPLRRRRPGKGGGWMKY